MVSVHTPVTDDVIRQLHIGDRITISGIIYTGRDAVLPKLCDCIEKNAALLKDINLEGGVIFHTAVSVAGVGPTSSNKYEIEMSIPVLSQAGVKIHMGKGEISRQTVKELDRYHSVYAVIPPVTALLNSKTLSKETAAFPELGMEAMYRLQVVEYPVIIAAAHGESIYDKGVCENA